MKPPAHYPQAIAQWQKEVEDHIPGLKVSNLPCLFVVPVKLDAGRKATTTVDLGWVLHISQRDQWERIPEVLKAIVSDYQKGWIPPTGWSYPSIAEKVAPRVLPHPLDIPNPRHYTLEGSQLPRHPLESEGIWATGIIEAFKKRLGVLWQPEPEVFPPNPETKRKERVREFLDYHHSKGGNPKAFRLFIEGIARNPEDMPPPPTMTNILNEMQGWKYSPVRDPAGLSKVLSEWIGDVERMAKLTAMITGTLQHGLDEYARDRGQRVHGNALQAAIDAKAQSMSEKDADCYAVQLWDEARASASRGLSVCPFPRIFRLGHTPGLEITAEFMSKHRENISEAVSECVNKEIKKSEKAADGQNTDDTSKPWQYADISPQGTPHPWDIPNPRIYRLSGMQVPTHVEMNALAVVWRKMLLKLWRDTGPDERTERVHAFLSHHLERGRKPSAFIEFVDITVEGWSGAVRSSSGPAPANITLPSAALVKRMEQWLEAARYAPNFANEPPKHEAPTFAALFGDRLPEVLKAMKDAGIQPVTGKGIGKVLATLHAACVHYDKTIPAAHLWPAMLEQLFPDIKCSPKVQPILSTRELEGRSAYARTYRAILDRLK
jgi:hypothetical protein